MWDITLTLFVFLVEKRWMFPLSYHCLSNSILGLGEGISMFGVLTIQVVFLVNPTFVVCRTLLPLVCFIYSLDDKDSIEG